MNPLQACKTTLKEMKPILEKHPANANLKKWSARFTSAIAASKKKGYSAEFEQFWKLYGARTGSKAEAYGVWQKEVVNAGLEPSLVIAAVKPYKADCKKLDQTLAHARTWLSQKRWESYGDVSKAVDMCQICKNLPVSGSIMVKYSDGGYKDKRVCSSCQKYSGLTVEEVLKRLGKVSPAGGITPATDKKGKDTTTPSCSQESGAGSLSASQQDQAETLPIDGEPVNGASDVSAPFNKRIQEIRDWDSKRMGAKI